MWWQFCYVFLRMWRFFHNLKAFFAPFFHVEAFLLRLSPYGGLFSLFKSLSATFSSMWGPFYYVFLLMWGFFHYLKALLLRFSPFGGPFSPFKCLSATFFLYVKAFLLRFSCEEGFSPPFEGLSATFFSMWECCFWFYGDPFWLATPPTKILAGAHACVSLNPYE